MRSLLLTGFVAYMLLGSTELLAERGSSGELRIIYWQAPSILNPYLSGGAKDAESASMMLEPLARYNAEGVIVPYLAADIPTLENGGVARDLKSITWTLKEGIKWSDGTDFTVDDVVFTANYCMHPDSGCQFLSNFADVASVVPVDDRTVKVTFKVAKPYPYGPFVGNESPILQKDQFQDCIGASAPECAKQNFAPQGTGPFKVVEFRPNDVIRLEANQHYREPSKPAFATVLFKGGGDAASAARSVLETGEFDYAWNLQVEPEVLNKMAEAGNGEVLSAFGTGVERLMVNLTNPDASLGTKRSTVAGGVHPFLTDTRVTRALSLAIDRKVIKDIGYGAAGQVTCNVLPAPTYIASSQNDWCKTQDVAQAKKLLDDAGWVVEPEGRRVKDGIPLSLLFQTSTNSVRQGTQALIKQMWQNIGVEVELRHVEGSIFFGSDQSSPDTFQKFFADIEMYTNNFNGTDPENYLGNWACSNIPAPDNQWLGFNMPRFCDAHYDALLAELATTGNFDRRNELAIELNDLLVEKGAIIPLVHRGRVSARSLSLNGVQLNAWDSELWNIVDWSRAD